MPSCTNERTKQMMREFMPLRQSGLSIEQIAEKFSVGRSTVYEHLQEIADANGVTREELLYFVHKPHDFPEKIHKNPRFFVNPQELKAEFNSMISASTVIITNISRSLTDEQTHFQNAED